MLRGVLAGCVILLSCAAPVLAQPAKIARRAPRVDLSPLVADLESHDPQRAGRALPLLGASGSAAAVPPLEAFLRRGPPSDLLLPAIAALGALGRLEAQDVLIALLRHHSAAVRARTVVALSPLRSRRVSAALVAALGDPDEAVRDYAAGALSTAGTTDAIDPLFAALEAGNARAAEAVGALGGASQVERLLSVPTPLPVTTVLGACRAFVERPDVREGDKIALADRIAAMADPEVARVVEALPAFVPRAQRRLREHLAELIARRLLAEPVARRAP